MANGSWGEVRDENGLKQTLRGRAQVVLSCNQGVDEGPPKQDPVMASPISRPEPH